MTREELLIDRDKIARTIKAHQKAIGEAQVQLLRLEGALAYIEGNLEESDNDKQEPDRTE